MRNITTKAERQTMNASKKQVRSLMIVLSFLAIMPMSMLPTMADTIPGPDSIPGTTTPNLNSSINGGYVGKGTDWNDTTGGTFNVNVADDLGAGGVAQFNWNTFNVGKDVTVKWGFTNNNQTAINKVLNNGGMSQIYGKLTSGCAGANCSEYKNSGNVMLINPNGILFGAGSTVNLNSFTASTKNIEGLQDNLSNGMSYLEGTLVQKAIADSQGVNYVFNSKTVNTDGKLIGDAIISKWKYGQDIVFEGNNNFVDANGNGWVTGAGDKKLASITLDGTTFNNEAQPAGKGAKSVALIGNQINVKDSTVKTYVSDTENGNCNTQDTNNHNVTQSNIKFITSDGVTFKYAATGALTEVKNAKAAVGSEGFQYGVNMDNATVESGQFQIYDSILTRAKGTDPKPTDVSIRNTKLTADKMYNGTPGTINIASAGDITIDKSYLKTNQKYANDRDNQVAFVGQGDITVAATGNLRITDSKIKTADSTLNNNSTGTHFGNISLKGKNSVQIINGPNSSVNPTIQNTDSKQNRINAAGDITIESGGDITIDMGMQYSGTEGDKTSPSHKILAQGTQSIAGSGFRDRTLTISGKNVKIENAFASAGKVDIAAGNYDATNETISGGGIIVKNSILHSFGDLNAKGYETTFDNDILAYKKLNLASTTSDGYDMVENYGDYRLGNDVLILGDTTFIDKSVDAGLTDTLHIKTNGELIVDNGSLGRRTFSDAADNLMHIYGETATNATNIKLESTQNQVSVRNNSNITANGNIELKAKTNANVANSTVTSANGNITLDGGSKVTVGDVGVTLDENYNITGNTKGNGSTLTASNGTITLHTTGDVTDPLNTTGNKGIYILNSTLNAKDNTYTADNGVLGLNQATVTASNNNKLEAKNGSVVIQKGNYAKGSIVRAAGTSDVKASDNVYISNAGATGDAKSKVISGSTNNITSTGGKVSVQSGEVTSTNGNVNITQKLTMDLNQNFADSKITAGNGNIKLTVTGAGEDITGSTNSILLDNGVFTHNKGRLQLDSADAITLTSPESILLDRVDVKSGTGETTITSDKSILLANNTAYGDAFGILDGSGKTILNAALNVKNKSASGTGVINVNKNKLAVNAGQNVDLSLRNADNANKGLEVNAEIDTHTRALGKANLLGKSVKLTPVAGAGGTTKLAVSKIKAGSLEFGTTPANIIAATDVTMTAKENTSAVTGTAGRANKAYIEVSEQGQFNFDPNWTDWENIPGFYTANGHYDVYQTVPEADESTTEYTAKHFVGFTNSANPDVLLVYDRASKNTECDPDDVPSTPVGPDTLDLAGIGLDESAFVRQPKHLEGVSLVAPVQNEITDPTANVIMAAARLTIDENEAESEDEDIQEAF